MRAKRTAPNMPTASIVDVNQLIVYHLMRGKEKTEGKAEMTRSISDGVREPNLENTISLERVASLTTRTVDGKGRPAFSQSFRGTSPRPGRAYLSFFEVICQRIRSGSSSQIRRLPSTRAGLGFALERSENGKGTKTTSPGLKSVIDGVFGGKPIFCERSFGETTPSQFLFSF